MSDFSGLGVMAGVTGDHLLAARAQVMQDDAEPLLRNLLSTILAAAQADSGDIAGALETARMIR